MHLNCAVQVLLIDPAKELAKLVKSDWGVPYNPPPCEGLFARVSCVCARVNSTRIRSAQLSLPQPRTGRCLDRTYMHSGSMTWASQLKAVRKCGGQLAYRTLDMRYLILICALASCPCAPHSGCKVLQQLQLVPGGLPG
jgi:hypothetical protein